jgi:hypothetical protein
VTSAIDTDETVESTLREALSGVSDRTLSKAEVKKLVEELTSALKHKKTAIDDLERSPTASRRSPPARFGSGSPSQARAVRETGIRRAAG